MIIANRPNSKPLKGKAAKKPLNPRIPNNPSAQDAQAGAKRPAMILEELA